MLTTKINAQSIKDITGQNTLWDAIAVYNDIKPTELTKTHFRELVSLYANSVGLNYSPKNSYHNNILILNASLPSHEETMTKNENVYTNYSRDHVDAIRALSGCRIRPQGVFKNID